MSDGRKILLVEDNDDDAELTLQAFVDARITNPLIRVSDGVEALDYLFRRGKHADSEDWAFPAVVLLDLNLPKVSGLEVLQEIRENDRTRHLPVVILSSSREEKDRSGAYSKYANSYIVKPVDYDEFVEAARQIGLYWIVLNVPPPAA